MNVHAGFTKKAYSNRIKHLLYLLILPAGCVIFHFFFPLQSWGTPPSRIVHAFDWEPIKQATRLVFKSDAVQFFNRMEPTLKPVPREINRNGFNSSEELFGEIAQIIRPMLIHQDIESVREYFKIINSGGWIVGRNSSPDYTGDTVVTLELETDKNKEYRVLFRDWGVNRHETSPVMGIYYPTGVRALPIFQQDDKIIFTNVNTFKIRNRTWGDRQGPQNSTFFTIDQPYLIHEIGTGHWPYEPEMKTGTIQLIKDGKEPFGPWQTTPLGRFGGYNTVFWLYHPDIILQPGTYQIVDSDPDTWKNNDISGRQGMSWVIGSPVH